jgi:N-acetylglucosamine-6-phosphate deacetylase
MARVLLRNAEILDPEGTAPRVGNLLLDGDRILAHIAENDALPDDARVIDLAGSKLAPGLLDLHYHGSAVFSGGDGLDDALRRDSASCARHGVTAFLATTVTWPMTHLGEFVTRCVASVSKGSWPGAEPIGLHLEGPWINPGAAGAQPRADIAPFREAEGAELLDRGEGAIRLVTLAPEIEGAPALQVQLSRRGIAAALGHSLASAEVASESVGRGARHVTHLFNAMGELHHRSPGLAAAALSDDRLTCDLICDGAHVHPRVVAVAARAKGDGLMLISDHVEPPAAPDGARSFGSGVVRPSSGELDDDLAWRLEDGRLAGSRLTLDVALRNLGRFTGASLLEAVAACSLRPARLLGIEGERGSLRPGARADLAVLDETLRVTETWIAGRRVYPV